MGDDPLVLCYHAVSEDWGASLSLPPDLFERQVAKLTARGYEGRSLFEALSRPRRRTVVFTFDDAYRSVLELAEPILSAYGHVATVFAPTRFIGEPVPMSWPGIEQWLGGRHEHELMSLSWEQLGELVDRGWEVGSHTASHPRLTELAPDALRAELSESKATCERRLGRACDSIAYPYGDHDAAVVEAARAAGYSYGVTLPTRPHQASPLRWPRVGIYYTDEGLRFTIKTSPAMRHLGSKLGGHL